MEHDPKRVLPELVMALNVVLAKPIPRPNAAHRLEMVVSIKGSKVRCAWMMHLHCIHTHICICICILLSYYLMV